jgi:hypothetical protein
VGNVMSVCSWGIRDSGQETTWRSTKPEEGSGRWQGLTTEPVTRGSTRSKASKPRGLKRGTDSSGSVSRRNGKGATSGR